MLTYKEYLYEEKKSPLERFMENEKLYWALFDYLKNGGGRTRFNYFTLDNRRDKLSKFRRAIPREYRTTSRDLLFRGLILDRDDVGKIVSGQNKFELGKTGSWTEDVGIAERFAKGTIKFRIDVPPNRRVGIVFGQRWNADHDIIINVRMFLDDFLAAAMNRGIEMDVNEKAFLRTKRNEHEVVIDTAGQSLIKRNIYKVYVNGMGMSPDMYARMEN